MTRRARRQKVDTDHDPVPDETIIAKEGAVQRWDRSDGMTFRLDLWSVEDDPDSVDEAPNSSESVK